MKIESIRTMLDSKAVKWSTHCLEKMAERDINIEEVKSCISNGEIIEDYPNDFPYPSCLIYGLGMDKRVIHVVVGSDGFSAYIITAYIPNTVKFEEDLKTRRK